VGGFYPDFDLYMRDVINGEVCYQGNLSTSLLRLNYDAYPYGVWGPFDNVPPERIVTSLNGLFEPGTQFMSSDHVFEGWYQQWGSSAYSVYYAEFIVYNVVSINITLNGTVITPGNSHVLPLEYAGFSSVKGSARDFVPTIDFEILCG
jgi:hypothetical protein